jgi:DAK2 domain fusion protein YloV
MSSTMRAAVDAVAGVTGGGARDVAVAAARGALMGAKGNSGVILSQILHGLAAFPEDDDQLDADGLAAAFERAREAAYRVVSEPKEGTILTAIAAAAKAASADADDVDACFAAAVEGARDAVARTPDLLPVLKEAGVVDSGAQGLYVMLDGMLRGLRGLREPAPPQDLGKIDESYSSATKALHGNGGSGFCTEFVIEGATVDQAALRAELQTMGESVLVVGDRDLARIHIHTPEPDRALAYGRTLGEVSREKVDDLSLQIDSAAARRNGATPLVEGVAVVAIAAGGGIERLFGSLGAAAVVRGGQTMNPSAGEIRAAIEGSGAAHVVVLPNNKNVVLAARQAGESASADVEVIPTTSVPEGIAALVAVNTEAPFEEIVAAMLEACQDVRSAEVTKAARNTRMNDVEVAAGQAIAIVDGELAVSAATIGDAVHDAVARMIEGRDEPLVTLYYGEAEDEQSAEAIGERLRGEFGCEVETVEGGQPHYPYLIGVE